MRVKLNFLLTMSNFPLFPPVIYQNSSRTSAKDEIIVDVLHAHLPNTSLGFVTCAFWHGFWFIQFRSSWMFLLHTWNTIIRQMYISRHRRKFVNTGFLINDAKKTVKIKGHASAGNLSLMSRLPNVGHPEDIYLRLVVAILSKELDIWEHAYALDEYVEGLDMS